MEDFASESIFQFLPARDGSVTALGMQRHVKKDNNGQDRSGYYHSFGGFTLTEAIPRYWIAGFSRCPRKAKNGDQRTRRAPSGPSAATTG